MSGVSGQTWEHGAEECHLKQSLLFSISTGRQMPSRMSLPESCLDIWQRAFCRSARGNSILQPHTQSRKAGEGPGQLGLAGPRAVPRKRRAAFHSLFASASVSLHSVASACGDAAAAAALIVWYPACRKRSSSSVGDRPSSSSRSFKLDMASAVREPRDNRGQLACPRSSLAKPGRKEQFLIEERARVECEELTPVNV